MKKSYHLPAIVFSLMLLWGGVLSVKMLRPLIPLYQDKHMRAQVQSVIQHFADEQGYLLSSIRIDDISKSFVQVSVREYRRGLDTRQTYSIPLFLP